MLKERRHYYKKQRRSTTKDSRLKIVDVLKRKRDRLADKIERIKNKQNIYALATEEENITLARLNRIKRSLKRLAKKEDFSEKKEKYDLFRGLLLWDIATDYTPRYWKVKSELNQIDKGLKTSTKRLQSIRLSSKNAPHAFSGFEKRIKSKERQLEKLLNKISRVLILQIGRAHV